MWSNEQKKSFAKAYALTCKMFNMQQVDPDMVVMVVDDLQDLDFNACICALEAYRKDFKNKGWPRPSDLRALVIPPIDDDSKAVEAASRTVAAVSKFGWNKPKEAREYIGELGWVAVQRFGGWMYICENLGVDISITTFQAQIRDLSKAILKLDKAGSFDQPINMIGNAKEKPQELEPAANILKLVEFKEMKK